MRCFAPILLSRELHPHPWTPHSDGAGREPPTLPGPLENNRENTKQLKSNQEKPSQPKELPGDAGAGWPCPGAGSDVLVPILRDPAMEGMEGGCLPALTTSPPPKLRDALITFSIQICCYLIRRGLAAGKGEYF